MHTFLFFLYTYIYILYCFVMRNIYLYYFYILKKYYCNKMNRVDLKEDSYWNIEIEM